jgi:hypothetical protein
MVAETTGYQKTGETSLTLLFSDYRRVNVPRTCLLAYIFGSPWRLKTQIQSRFLCVSSTNRGIQTARNIFESVLELSRESTI